MCLIRVFLSKHNTFVSILSQKSWATTTACMQALKSFLFPGVIILPNTDASSHIQWNSSSMCQALSPGFVLLSRCMVEHTGSYKLITSPPVLTQWVKQLAADPSAGAEYSHTQHTRAEEHTLLYKHCRLWWMSKHENTQISECTPLTIWYAWRWMSWNALG